MQARRLVSTVIAACAVAMLAAPIAASATAAPSISPLANGVAVTGIAGASGSQQYWQLDVPAGQHQLAFFLSGGSGYADLYVRRGAIPTPSVADCHRTREYVGPACVFSSPAAGSYYVLVASNGGFTGVTLVGTWNEFSMSVLPAETTALSGSTVTTTVSTATTSGTSQPVALAVSGAPSGATFSLASASVTSGGSSTLVLTTASGTRPGPYTITITGTGSIRHTTTFTLTVLAAPPLQLTNATPVSALSSQYADLYWQIDVPAGLDELTVTTRGGGGELALYVRRGSVPTDTKRDCRQDGTGTNETCSILTPAAGTWYVRIDPEMYFSGVTLTATYRDWIPALTNNVRVRNISGSGQSGQFWKLKVPAGQHRVIFTLRGSTRNGNADLFVRAGAVPINVYDCLSNGAHNVETCTLPAVAGTYYVMVWGTTAFSQVTLRGRYF